MKPELSFRKKLEAYHLSQQVVVITVLVLVTIASAAVYMIPDVRKNEIAANLLLAVFTSLMASIVAITVETYVSYKAAEKDEFIEDLHTFGIARLNHNKEEALRKLLFTCDKELWISGYRLIMTANLRHDIAAAIEHHGVNVRILVCPPWSEAFHLIYDEDKVMDHYFEIAHTLYRAQQHYYQQTGDRHKAKIEFRTVRRPIFNDTYKVDTRFVTGPYMHNKDKDNKKITAKDFFSYDVMERSTFYTLVKDEFEGLWMEADSVLDLAALEEQYQQYRNSDCNDREKQQLFRAALLPLSAAEPDTPDKQHAAL